MTPRLTIKGLGYAGLVPFVLPAVLVATGSTYSAIAIELAELYAFGIICFLTGTWWGMASGTEKQTVILASNLYFLAALLLLVLAPAWWSLAAALLLVGIVILEQSWLPMLPGFYRRLRRVLTLVAASSMLVIHFLQ